MSEEAQVMLSVQNLCFILSDINSQYWLTICVNLAHGQCLLNIASVTCLMQEAGVWNLRQSILNVYFSN